MSKWYGELGQNQPFRSPFIHWFFIAIHPQVRVISSSPDVKSVKAQHQNPDLFALSYQASRLRNEK